MRRFRSITRGVRLPILAACVAIAGCASGGPPTVDADARRPQPAPSVYSLIGDRERLDLSSEQVETLDSIGRWLIDVNSPLNERLRNLGVAPGLGVRMDRRGPPPPEAAPLIEQVRENNRQAVAGVERVLTAEQRAQVCNQPSRRRTPGPETSRREPRRPGRPMAADSAMGMAPGRWPWCRTDEAAQSGVGAATADRV